MAKTKGALPNQPVPEFTRHPKNSPDVANPQKLSFRFSQLDEGGDWSFKKKLKGDHVTSFLKTLKKLEDYTFEDAKSSGILADYDMGSCPNKRATKRLAEQYGGQDSLCRIKVVGGSRSRRLFGIRTGNVISLIWYDSDHSVWPTGS